MSRYRSVHCLIWNDDKFPFASDACQLVFFHMLTTPMSSPFGLYKASLEALAAEKRWELKAYREAFQEAFGKGFVKYDERAQVILIPNFLKYNPPNNPNVLRAWFNVFHEIPNSRLKSEFFRTLESRCEAFGKGFQQAFVEAWRKGTPIQEQDQDQEQEQDQEVGAEVSRRDARASTGELPGLSIPESNGKGEPSPDASAVLLRIVSAMKGEKFLVPGAGEQTIWDNAKRPLGLAEKLEDACPSVDVASLIVRLAGWSVANPSRAKRDLGKFLWNAATHEQDKPKTGGASSEAYRHGTDLAAKVRGTRRGTDR